MAGILPAFTYGNENGSSALPRLLDENSQQFVDTGPGITGQPSRYQDLLDANPYRGLTYNESGWQKFLSGLGFRTSADDFREQAEINAREYDAGIMSMKMQNEYNSPLEMASRMRDAGLNPDLQGIGDVAESASPTEDPNGMPAQDSSQMFGRAVSAVQTFAGGFAGIISGAMAMMKNFQDINNTRLENDRLATGIAEEDVFKSIPANGFLNQEEFDTWLDHATHMMEFDDEYFKIRNIPRSARQAYKTAYVRSLNNLPTDIARYKSSLERAKLRKEYSMFTGSQFYTEESDEALGDIVEPLVKLSDRLTLLEQKLANAVARNDIVEQNIRSDELDTLDKGDYGQLVGQNKITEANIVSGELQNRGIESDIRSQELDFLQGVDYGQVIAEQKYFDAVIGRMIAETQNDIISRLRTSSQNGSRLAKCLEYQMVLSKFYNWNPSEAIGHVLDQRNAKKRQVGDTFSHLASLFILKGL